MVLGGNGRQWEEKGDDTSRGVYSPVNPAISNRSSLNRRFIALAPMVALLVFGATLMAVHHIFYSHLNEVSVDAAVPELPALLRNQSNVNFIGTTIAHCARILLSIAIGVTFTQLFWDTLRFRTLTIAQIDALVNCGQSPFHPSAFRAVTASFLLFIVSLTASATALVVVLSPGSLTITTNFQRTRPCAVPSVPSKVMKSEFSQENTFGILLGQQAVMASIPTSNTYLPPFQEDFASTCGGGISSCYYNLSFVAPALQCIDITDQTNFTWFLNPTNAPTNQPFTIWNSTLYDGDVIGVTILTRDLEKDVLQANNCTAFNATYNVGVSLQDGSATVDVWNVDRGAALLRDTSFLSFYGQSGVGLLNGVGYAGPNAPVYGGVYSGSFFVTTPTGNHTFGDTVSHFATSLVQNVSISLLSGNIYYNFSNDTATNLERTILTCSSSVNVYTYDSARLLSTYGVILGIATVVVAYGCWLIIQNEAEQRVVFSEVMKVVLNEDMFRMGAKIQAQERTRVQLIRPKSALRRLVPSFPLDDNAFESRILPVLPRRPLLSLGRRYLTPVQWKMALFILATVVIMILNHTYYHYLDGKTPSTSLHISRSSGWALNQTVVSDVGIALAYLGQTFLAVSILTACAQLFWHAVRRRGHTIARIDNLMRVQVTPFTLSLFSALRASLGVPLLAVLAALTPLISIFAPGSIEVVSDHVNSQDCTVLAPQNLTALTTNASLGTQVGGYTPLLTEVLTLGTYLPPIDVCGSGSGTTSACSYDLEFVGPGFECQDVTASSNRTLFEILMGPNTTDLYQAQLVPQTADDLRLRVSVQAYDVGRSEYQAINCTGVLHSYSVSISKAPTPIINVTNSQTISTIHANRSELLTFAENYVYNMMILLVEPEAYLSEDGDMQANFGPLLSPMGGIGAAQLNGDITWSTNMTRSLEDYAQNATLSIFSGQVMTMNAEVTDILQNATTTCRYTSTAYEYTSYRLFVTYGVAIFVAVLCAVWGSVAIRRNGVDETMDFSRILRAVLNERMYDVRGGLDRDMVVKADDTAEGALAPAYRSA